MKFIDMGLTLEEYGSLLRDRSLAIKKMIAAKKHAATGRFVERVREKYSRT